MPNGASYNVASLFAKTDAVKITSPIRTVASKIGEFSKTDIGSNSEAERYYKSYGDYTNTLMIYVDCGTDNSKVATLTLGIKVDGENVPAETGVAVDAFLMAITWCWMRILPISIISPRKRAISNITTLYSICTDY